MRLSLLKPERSLLVAAAALLLSLASPAVHAHGPTPQKAQASITIAAPPDVIWKLVSDFGAIGTWHPDIKAVRSTGSGDGTERVLVLEKGEITDSLDERDDNARHLSYRLGQENVEAFPVSFYTATMTVTDAGHGSSTVDWAARLYRGDTSNFPPDELNDEAATTAMTQFFTDGLSGLKTKVEAASAPASH